MSNSESKIVVYDPDPDPTETQLKAWGNIGIEDLDAIALSNPEAVKLLIESWRVTLRELKAKKIEISSQKDEIAKLRDERENLRVALAGEEAKSRLTLLEIPISILSGFAINLLSTTPSSGTGWFLLIISLLMLVFLRSSEIREIFGRGGKSDGTN